MLDRLELSPQGFLLLWFGLALSVISILFSSPPTFLASALVFALIAFLIFNFRKLVKALSNQVSIKLNPQEISTLVGSKFTLQVSLTNSSSLPAWVTAFHLNIPDEIEDGSKRQGEQLLEGQSVLQYVKLMKAKSPGRFEITEARVALRDRTKILRHVLGLKCKGSIEAVPTAILLQPRSEVISLTELVAADPRRLGGGTDLAGIREAVSENDFRTIDWKSTARTGKFMTKLFYQETDPQIVFALDNSILSKPRPKDPANSPLTLVTSLVGSLGSSIPVGLVLYDDSDVLMYLAPSAGSQGRRQILHSLMVGAGKRAERPSQYATRLYGELTNMIYLLQASESVRDQPRGTLDLFARSILPYFKNAASNYAKELETEGLFRAFHVISTIPQPTLVLAIADIRNRLNGLCEGALLASRAGHFVVVAIIGGVRDVLPPEIITLRGTGIRVLQCTPLDFADALRNELMNIPRLQTARITNQRTLTTFSAKT